MLDVCVCVFSFSISDMFLFFVYPSEAYDALDPNGNITIKWDVINWTPDGYVVGVDSFD